MKPGVLTSEFLGSAGVSAGLLYLALDSHAPELVRAAACIGAAIAAYGYSLARGTAKAKAKAVANPAEPG